MLELKNIFKSYKVKNNVNKVLNNINISFRKKEFVCILGPSGSGKTTLLNIIGGLDSYDSGDLLINNVSTKTFNDKNWDSYRNNNIGFIFQSYNLISHLPVLKNVELPLLLTGMSKRVIRKKSINILKNLGLNKYLYNKPNQLSGGQKQRVAIARALINNPEIIVADEPTGALDSDTSCEIMKILKKISNDKLVIMVTHNSDLAEKYATRIINLIDGKIISDSNPFCNIKSNLTKKYLRKKHFKFSTALSLSFYNLLTKKKRTMLTSIACSIGIIGISLVLAISNGVNKYINEVEKDSYKDYPIIINKKSFNILNSFTSSLNMSEKKCDKNHVCVYNGEDADLRINDLKSFNNYINKNKTLFVNNSQKIINSYDVDINIFNNNYDKINVDFIKEDNNLAQGKIIYGRLPISYDEIAIVLNTERTITRNMKNYLLNNQDDIIAFDKLTNIKLKFVPNTYLFVKTNNQYVDYSSGSNKQIISDNGIDLKIVGIIVNDNISESYIAYTNDLVIANIKKGYDSELFKNQINNNSINLLNNKLFNDYDNTYEDLQKKIGLYNLDDPSSITIYPKDNKSKNKLIKLIDDYNNKNENKIYYNDMMKILVKGITKTLGIVTYVLICFISISFVVSSIMISIITYISVLERTKEIGILRSIGASKSDIKKIFNSETVIEGLIAGMIGIFVSYLLSVLVSFYITHYLKMNIEIYLTIKQNLLMIFISVFLNYLSGIKPARIAAKCNPITSLNSI